MQTRTAIRSVITGHVPGSQTRTGDSRAQAGIWPRRLLLGLTGFLAGSAFIHSQRVRATSCGDSIVHHYYFQFIRAEAADGTVLAENPSDLPEDLEIVGGPADGNVYLLDDDKNRILFEIQE